MECLMAYMAVVQCSPISYPPPYNYRVCMFCKAGTVFYFSTDE